MHFAIDVDQTICGENAYEVYASFYNKDLQLGIDDATIHRLTSYHDFINLPQVRHYYQGHEKEWNAARRRAIETPEVLQAFSPIHGAVEGVKQLASYGSVGYYSARSPQVQAVTQQWLECYSFSQSQCLVCCASIEQKLLTLADHKPSNEPIYLIDDRGHTHVLSILERIKDQSHIKTLLPRLTIVAFRAAPLPLVHLCPIIALPSWRDLQQISNIFLEVA